MAKRPSSRAKSSTDFTPQTRIVVLCGVEDLIKRRRLDELRAVLSEAHGEVETFAFDGRTAQLADVFDELRSFSLMQTYKLVVVDEADLWVKTHRAAVERYAEAPVDHATLVLRSTTWNKGNLDKLIEKVGGIVKCDALSPAEAQAELTRKAKDELGASLPVQSAGLLVERLGTELCRLEGELAKLALMVEPGKPITPELVASVVGRSNDEQAYVVQDAVLEAIASGRCGEPIAKAHDLVDLGGQADVLVNYFVADLMRKLTTAMEAKRANVPEAEIAKRAKVWGGRARPFFEALKKLDDAKAGRWFDGAVEADARSKSGLGDPLRNLERFCVSLADRGR